MPVTPGSARRSSNARRQEQTSSSREATPKSQSLHEAASVQDRIRQWQARSAADALPPDALSVRSFPLSERANSLAESESHIGGDDTVSPKSGRNGSQNGGREERKGTRGSTPRKRVISDEHWKAQRDANGPRVSKSVRRPPAGAHRYDLSYTSTDDKKNGRRRSRRDRRTSAGTRSNQQDGDRLRVRGAAGSDLEEERDGDGDDQCDVAASPEYDGVGERRPTSPSIPPVEENGRRSEETIRPDEEDGRHRRRRNNAETWDASRRASPSIALEEDDRRSEGTLRLDEDDGRHRRRSKYAETLGRQASDSREADHSILKPKKGRIFGRRKEIFTKREDEPAGSNRIPSIEAWLDEQPDPFVDDAFRDELPAAEVRERPRRRSTRHLSSGEQVTTLTDPNNIWNLVGQPESPKLENGGKPQTSSHEPMTDSHSPETPSHRPSDGQQPPDEVSPTRLRRRGAKARRTRGSRTREAYSSDQEVPSARSPPSQVSGRTQNGLERPCPPTGPHRLSTIASVETLREKSENPPVYQDTIAQDGCGLKRKLTTHEDLMSVLSLPRKGRSLRAARSVKSLRPRPGTDSAKQVLESLVAEEERYGRELRTLVDGVIPVLLQCVLSKADSAAAAGLFTSSGSAGNDLNITKPIIDMGIALERLKTLHNRIPLHHVDSLLGWAQTAQKAYSDYLNSWRLGFQDVVVNLAPLDDGQHETDQGMARDENGDVINAEGKKVDVAYLLKRPLVRVKNLSKTFNGIRDQSDRPLAHQIAQSYADLTVMAKRRHKEEQGRLEDEAAAHIDAMRARDIRTMAATAGVTVDKSRKVRARDSFSLTLYHSSCQRIDCSIELILRDNAGDGSPGGDVLICEVDETGKWLLFAPVELNAISARRGESGFDLVVMVRGPAGFGREWHELLALKTDDPEAATEWMGMLGSNPLPPKLNRTSSFVKRHKECVTNSEAQNLTPEENEQQPLTQSPGLTDADVPIGEPSLLGSRRAWNPRPDISKPLVDRPKQGLHLGGGLQSKPTPLFPPSPVVIDRKSLPSVHSSDRSTLSDRSTKTLPKLPSSQPTFPSPQHETPTKCVKSTSRDKRSPAASLVNSSPRSLGDPRPKIKSTDEGSREQRRTPPETRQHLPSNLGRASGSPQSAHPKPESVDRVLSSTPSKELPFVAKLRTPSSPVSPSSGRGHRAAPEDSSRARIEDQTRSQRDKVTKSSSRSQIYTEDVPAPPPHLAQRDQRPFPTARAPLSAPAPPIHQDTSLLPSASSGGPGLERQIYSNPKNPSSKRGSSSPLKHEYSPSTDSDSSSEYDTESVSDDSSSSSSETTEDEASENGDKATPLVAVTAGGRRASRVVQNPTAPLPSTGTRTLAPSDSASQGPYRKVPVSSAYKKSKTIALVCSWSDKGQWEQIHPDECSIVISPGLIEAFEMSAAHSDPRALAQMEESGESDSRASSLSRQPLVAFELTPIVPLRRGTALDISIRSPPTPNSRMKTTSNVMFRSRNAEECDALYGMINWARCNNPTYIQLQNARRYHHQPSVTFNVGQANHSQSKSSSWFSFGGSQRKSSYRASSAPTPASIGGASDASAGTMASAFSALKRFSATSAFNLNRSSVLRKTGQSTGESLSSSDSGPRTGSGSGSSTQAPSQIGLVPGKDGPNVPLTSAAAVDGGGMINNMKIRLYIRKGQHWENLGAARLSVLPLPTLNASGGGDVGVTLPSQVENLDPRPPGPGTPPRPPSTVVVGQPGQSRGPRLPSSSHTPHRIHGNGREKRIVVTRNKNRDLVLLDAILGESCFERVMQTGIAVKVWTADEVIGNTGGVMMGKEKLYMMQFPGTKEAGWVFSLVGTYRYGNALD